MQVFGMSFGRRSYNKLSSSINLQATFCSLSIIIIFMFSVTCYHYSPYNNNNNNNECVGNWMSCNLFPEARHFLMLCKYVFGGRRLAYDELKVANNDKAKTLIFNSRNIRFTFIQKVTTANIRGRLGVSATGHMSAGSIRLN